MSGAITWEQVASLIGVFGALSLIWWRIHARINQVDRSLQQYKTYVAEHFVSEHTMREIEERISRDIRGLGERVDKVLERLPMAGR